MRLPGGKHLSLPCPDMIQMSPFPAAARLRAVSCFPKLGISGGLDTEAFRPARQPGCLVLHPYLIACHRLTHPLSHLPA